MASNNILPNSPISCFGIRLSNASFKEASIPSPKGFTSSPDTPTAWERPPQYTDQEDQLLKPYGFVRAYFDEPSIPFLFNWKLF